MSDTHQLTAANPWWSAWSRKDNPSDTLIPLVQELWSRSATLRDNTRRLMSIYQWGFRGSEGASPDVEPGLDTKRNAYNAARNAIQTKAAMLCKTKVLPRALTDGAGYLAQQQARKLSKAVEGEMTTNAWDSIKKKVVMDFLVTSHGAGAFHVYSTRGKTQRIRIDHVPIEELLFDDTETRYGDPPCMYRKTRMDRFRVLAEYGGADDDLYGSREDRRRMILTAPSSSREGEGGKRVGGIDQIDVYEAWRKCTEDRDDYDDEDTDATDDDSVYSRGRHVIALASGTLVDEPFLRPRFPIYVAAPLKRFRAFFGLGDMSELAPSQREYEAVTEDIQNAHSRMGTSGWMVPENCDIDEREIANGRALVLKYTGNNPPQPFVAQPIHPDTYSYQQSIPRDMMTARGISLLSATSQLPAGMAQASGIALQTYENYESTRMMFEEQEIDELHVQLAWMVYDEARAIAADNDTGYASRYRGKDAIEDLDWKEIEADRKKVIFAVAATNALAKSPAARLQQLGEMMDRGAISLDQYKRAIGSLDVDETLNIDTADEDIIYKNLDLVYLKGRDIMPEGFDNLAKVVAIGGKYYNLRRADDDADEKGLERIRQFIAAAKALDEQQKAASAPPPMPAPMPGGPPPMGPPPGASPMMPPMNGAPPMAA